MIKTLLLLPNIINKNLEITVILNIINTLYIKIFGFSHLKQNFFKKLYNERALIFQQLLMLLFIH